MGDVDVALLAAILRGDPVPAGALAAHAPEALCRQAVRHGVAPLIAAHLPAHEASDLRRLCHAEARREAAVDLLREVELSRVLAGAHHRGLRPLVIKGAHLAYSHYPRPELRPRLDTDLLIALADRDGVHQLLTGLGYDAGGQVAGEHVKHQRTYVKRHGPAPVHVIDVHWQIANPQVFAGVLTYAEMAGRARALPALHPSASAPCDADALLLACIHRIAHHADFDRLIWTYDVHLLAGRLAADGWEAFLSAASSRGVAAICRAGVTRAIGCFHTAVPDAVLADPRWSGAVPAEPSAAYLEPRGQLQVLADNLRALSTWTARRRLVREHLFPPADYIRRVYAPSSTAPLPFLYAWRVLRGAPVWLGQSLIRARRRRPS